MPRRKYNQKPVLHPQKHEKYVMVEYEIMGKRGVKTLTIPSHPSHYELHSKIADHHKCESLDVWLVGDPVYVTNNQEETDEKVQK